MIAMVTARAGQQANIRNALNYEDLPENHSLTQLLEMFLASLSQG